MEELLLEYYLDKDKKSGGMREISSFVGINSGWYPSKVQLVVYGSSYFLSDIYKQSSIDFCTNLRVQYYILSQLLHTAIFIGLKLDQSSDDVVSYVNYIYDA